MRGNILDVGGFDGAISQSIVGDIRPLSVVVLDLDHDGLMLARQAGLSAVCGVVDNFPVRETSFDMVLCLDLIEHISGEDRLVQEIYRVLTAGGRLILSTPKSGGITFPFMSGDENRKINLQWGHRRTGYTAERLYDLLESNGFSIDYNGSYFNALTRLAYRMTVLSKKRYPFRKRLFTFCVRFESWFKFGTQEHMIIASKNGNWKG